MFPAKKILFGAIGFVLGAVLFTIVYPKLSISAEMQERRFTGREDHSIPLPAASAMTRNFRQGVPPGSLIGGAFSKDALQSVLSQPGCIGIRFYFADDNGTRTLVAVGINESGDDLVSGTVLERWFPCPPFCGSGDDLNR